MRVVIADDHRLILDGVRRALEADGGFEVVAETQSGEQVVELVDEHRPDLVLLDVRMPDMDGLACLELIKAKHPATPVVMLSASTSAELVENAIRKGASGYVLKAVDPADLPATLRGITAGNVFTAVGGADEASPSGAKAAGLTEREATILTELARGSSNDEIAKALWITQQTVKFHLTNIYRKLGVKSRTEAAREAYRLGLAPSLRPDDT